MMATTNNQRETRNRGLTHSAAHYLLATSECMESHGYARVADIARRLDLTRGSVSVAMQSLKSAEYVDQDENCFLRLTDRGRQAVRSIRARHAVVERVLVRVLGLSAEQAHREGCRLEYQIEAETTRRLLALLNYWEDQGLGGIVEAAALAGCPGCGEGSRDECPCCGLECIDEVLRGQEEQTAVARTLAEELNLGAR